MISLRCTVVRPDRPHDPCDVVVDAPVGATAADLVDRLVDEGVLDAPLALSTDGVTVPPTAPLGRRPLVNGVLLVAAAGWADPGRPLGSPLELHVVSGPDAGGVVPLRPGTVVVGRGPGSTVEVADPRLSRRHFELPLDSEGLRLRDLGSSNGTAVGANDVGEQAVACPPGTRIAAGASTFAVRSPGRRPVALRETGDGRIAVTRGPRARAAPAAVSFRRRAAPQPAERAPMPWLALLVPVLVCLPLAWWAHQPTYLLVGLLSPLSLGAGHVVERRRRRRRDRDDHAAWLSDDERTAALVDQALAAELAQRRTAAPDPALLLETARLPGHRLWERGDDAPDLLELVLGSGEVTSAVAVVADDGEQHPTLPCAPVLLDLAAAGHLGVCGPAAAVAGVLRHLVARLAVLGTPQVLRVVDLDEPAGWTRWLPHRVVRTTGELALEVRRRHELRRAGEPPPLPRVVVVVGDAAGWSDDPSFSVVLDDGPAVGVHVVAGADGSEHLPSRCGGVLSLDADGDVLTTSDGRRTELTADRVSPTWAEQVARALAPLQDATPRPGAVPDRVRLSEVCGVDLSADAIAARWRAAPRATRVAIGAGAHGPVHVDLVRDGPHALVAGTTGAGKSELLQTLVCSLALANRPDELAFVLVDYKGGAAFRELADLPHVVGLVTDLDGHLAERALASLQAELTRRERLLAQAGACDVGEYLALRDAGAVDEPLTRLVLVVDEFRLLADELPAFLDGLVRLASIGRSLGVHLVLATQRPAGVVSADIKANVNLRICLRVRDRTDSEDVVDAPDAAALPLDRPGRALLRTGSDALVPLQVALTGTTAPVDAARLRVRRAAPGEREPGALALAPAGAPDGPAPLVQAIRGAATACAATPPTTPWLPPLPEVVPLARAAQRDGATAVTYGLVDDPAQGTQRPLRWDAHASSHLAVTGTARSGRSSACVTMALAAGERLSPSDLHVHVVEAVPHVGPRLAGLPHLGTVALTTAPRLVAALVQRLAREGPRSRHTLLLVDGWEAVTETLDAVDHGRTTDELLALLRDGERWGLRAVVTGGRGVLAARVGGLLPERLVLRTADPTDLLLAGAATSARPSHQPPGRARHVPSQLEVQLAWPGDDAQVRHRVAALTRRHAGTGPTDPRPLRLQPLPRHARLDPTARRLPADTAVQVGVGGDDARPVELDLAGVPVVAVTGPPGSGRSSTLAAWATQLHQRGVALLAVAAPDSPLAGGPWPVHDPLAPDDVAHSADARCLVVDDADTLPEPVLQRLAAWAAAPERGRCLLFATTTDTLSASFTGLAAAVRRHRTGVLLQPERGLDGDAFGVVAERADVRTPGRGLLVVRGRATPVQVALPEGGPARAGTWGTAS